MVACALNQKVNSTKETCVSIDPNNNDNCTHTNPMDFLISYANFWYYCGICPFRLKYSPATQRFQVTKNLGQMIRSILSMILTTIYLLTSIRTIYIEHNLTKELNYFAISKACGNVVACWCFFLTIWKHSSNFESLINKYFARAYPSCSNYSSALQMTYLVPILILLMTLISLAAVFLSLVEVHEWNFLEIYAELLHKGEILSFRSNPATGILEQNLLAGVYLISILHYQVVDIASQLLIIISAFSLMSSISALQISLPKGSVAEAFREYLLLKEISRMNNQAVGVTVFGVVFGYIPFFMHVIPEIIQPKGPFALTNSLLSTCMPLAFLILAAKITNKASHVFGDQLSYCIGMSQDAKDLPKLSVFIFEISRREIGFSVGGFIKLTSSFLGAVLSLVLTFAVVIIQFNMPTAT